MADTIPDTGLVLPTCDPAAVPGDHLLDSAWGRTFCTCNHTVVVNFMNHPHRGGPELELETAPLWWLAALRRLPFDIDFDGLALPVLWLRLCDLAEDIADGQHSWDTWDEFCQVWAGGMPSHRAQRFLELLAEAGIAVVDVRSWDHADHAGVWHSGDQCGCREVNLTLLPIPNTNTHNNIESETP